MTIPVFENITKDWKVKDSSLVFIINGASNQVDFADDLTFRQIISQIEASIPALTVDVDGDTSVSRRKDVISFKATNLTEVIALCVNSGDLAKVLGFVVYDDECGEGDDISLYAVDGLIDTPYFGAARLPFFGYVPGLNSFFGVQIDKSMPFKASGTDRVSGDAVFSTPRKARNKKRFDFQYHESMIPSWNLFLKEMRRNTGQWKNYTDDTEYKVMIHESDYSDIGKFYYYRVYEYKLILLDTRKV